MKKIIFILFLITFFFLNSKTIFAFWVDLNWKGFYSSIADSMDKMESDLYKIDLVWKEWTMDKINKITWNNCLKDNLSVWEINYITQNWNIWLIIKKIDSSCMENWSLNNNTLTSIIDAVRKIDEEYKNKAAEKTSQIFNLWSTWIYSDWIEWNAPFDLIKDLQDIDSIIFMEESTIYEWNTDINLDAEILNLLWESDKNNKTEISYYNTVNLKNNSNNEFNNLKTYTNINSSSVYSEYLCSIDNSDSWLNENSLNFLNSDIKLNNTNLNITPSNSGALSNSWTNNKDKLAEEAIQNPKSDYKKVTDNNELPCESFFCIDIQFITYNHNLLGWWFQDITIEYLINRSNEHLKKFTNTSLVWSKMTINNFELWLKDLNLADIFHIWIQVTKKPVPILNIEKKEKKDDNIYSNENQLKFYYESYWLEYKRRNDLSLFKKVDIDKQIALNSWMMPTQLYLERIQDYNQYQSQKIEQQWVMNKLIENETKIWIMDNFEIQFKEIEWFNWWIKNYILNLDKIVSNMLKIPNSTNN